ncbi:hypothetical protein EOV40_009815 [Acetobacter oryzoeni]|uniref:Uncharacterized protein n=2 Tax=Acetobacter oryzoeni TaxID=2500548 RepID=A0A5B9GIV5_9PROT|nr:hypothetical protein EOV40_009815 [Acetobacter oryzoeni]
MPLTVNKENTDMNSIITSGITPAMIPGIRKAIEICEEYAAENCLICVDEVERLCQSNDWKDVTKHELAAIHRHQSNLCTRIADHLRAPIGEGDAA